VKREEGKGLHKTLNEKRREDKRRVEGKRETLISTKYMEHPRVSSWNGI
jgi:hypothetical protein